jgi:hypothetical protein
MPGPILYSKNPLFATEIAERYRNGLYFAWVSEYFDPGTAAAALVAPSSTPLTIYNRLKEDCNGADEHSSLIRDYRKKFTRLAKEWWSDKSIDQDQRDEIIASVRSKTFKIWKPVIYVIPRHAIDAVRIKSVTRRNRAGHGPELQILDLKRHEFDIIELRYD